MHTGCKVDVKVGNSLKVMEGVNKITCSHYKLKVTQILRQLEFSEYSNDRENCATFYVLMCRMNKTILYSLSSSMTL